MTIKLMLKVCCVAALAVLTFVALGPATWQPRSGIGWEIDHFVGYFVFTSMFCLAWPEPFLVGGALTVFAVLLEGLASFYAGSLVLLHGSRVQRRRSAGGGSAC